jgi:hypothetical protein
VSNFTVHVWDGVGPERECLIRLQSAEGDFWEHVEWRPGEDEESSDAYLRKISLERVVWRGVFGYQCDGYWRPTHWCEAPEAEAP